VNEAFLHQALHNSLNEVLEKMFFVEALGECATPSGDSPAADIAVTLAFQGEPSGSFLLRLTTVAARQIAADFLGLDEEEVSDTRISEVVRELANMICGSVLSRVENTATFNLCEPRIVPVPEEIAGSQSNARCCVQLSNGRLLANLCTGTLT
jgi:CheY-specific phosphatase CheX